LSNKFKIFENLEKNPGYMENHRKFLNPKLQKNGSKTLKQGKKP
jgi:hypothetical protein